MNDTNTTMTINEVPEQNRPAVMRIANFLAASEGGSPEDHIKTAWGQVKPFLVG